MTFSVNGDVTGVLLADRLQLEIVLRNLLTNAFDAVSARPVGSREVAIRAQRNGAQELTITIRDTGPGFPAEFHEHAYEPFRSTKTSGLGLGLAISHAIVKTHGGELRAISGLSGLIELVLPMEKDGV